VIDGVTGEFRDVGLRIWGVLLFRSDADSCCSSFKTLWQCFAIVWGLR
jgi:hypothetical protein